MLTYQWQLGNLGHSFSKTMEKATVNAARKAGSDAIRSTRTLASRTIRQRKRFKASAVAKALVLKFPRGGNSLESLEWRMDVSGRAVPVSAFNVRQTKAGVTAAINTGKRSLIKSAFLRTTSSGHLGVFLRTGAKRLPIREAYTTRISDVFKDADMLPELYAHASEKFSTAFARLFKLELEK